MISGSAVNAYVFCFCFAAGFLLTGKRPILTFSTRVLLVVLVALAIGYVAGESSPWHNVIGVAALILNLLFVAFAGIDGFAWYRRQAQR